jgi:hypothetical protein
MKWPDISEDARSWLKMLGDFGPTAHAKNRELKGYIAADEGEDGRTYLNSRDLREIAASCIEAADWLDKRADAAVPDVGAA